MAVTAYPVIKIDSTDGAKSDTAASGAGPATALTGSSATTNVGGTIVTLDGSPDLSGVATDGSHVIFYNDTTAGARRFAAINAKDDGADTVTVEQALAGSHAATAWAIGGVRATVFGSASLVLGNNNGGNGDAMPQWAIEMQSGHTESTASIAYGYRAGYITLRGVSGAATKPLITLTSGAEFMRPQGIGWEFKDFDVQTNVAGAEVFNEAASGGYLRAIGIGALDSGTQSWVSFLVPSDTGVYLDRCSIINATDDGFPVTGYVILLNCFADNPGGRGIEFVAGSLNAMSVKNCIVKDATLEGIYVDVSGTIATLFCLEDNTVHSCDGDGIEINMTISEAAMIITNNISANNGGWNLHFSGDTLEDILNTGNWYIGRNNTYNGTSGNVADSAGASTLLDDRDPHLDPQFTDAANDDFSVGTNMKAAGYPGDNNVGASGATKTYVDFGAAQREEPAGGGGTDSVLGVGELSGGFA